MGNKFLILLTAIMLSLVIFSSCKTDVNIYEEGEETTIVYGYLDVNADTNYIKITKSFIGNVLELAPDYSASNYDYKLNVKLIGKFATNPNAVQTEILDTTSIYKPYDPTGIFYSGRDQVLYYTTKKLLENTEYQLVIERNDGQVIKSKVKTISSSEVTKPWVTINFESNSTNQIAWKANDIYNLAAYYEVVGYFHYKQLNPGEDTVNYSMKWVLGSGTGEELWNGSTFRLSVNYTPSDFYKRLAADNNIVNNTPDYVKRFVDGFEVVVTSTGDELYNFILIQNSGSAIQDTPEYTNIDNGMGIFSSRSVCSRKVEVAEITVNTLMRDYPQWGFERIYN